MKRSPFWPPGLPDRLHLPRTSLVYNVEVAARRFPDKTAIQYFGTSVTYAELHGEIERMAGYLQHVCGVTPGDRVLLYSQNCPQFVVAYYAILRAEGVVVPANPMWLTDELAHVVHDSGASFACCASDLYPRLAPLHRDTLKHVIVHDYADALRGDSDIIVPDWASKPSPPLDAQGAVTYWRDALSAGKAPRPHQAGPDTLCVLPYTSGTTGKPKGCMHTHKTLMAGAIAPPMWYGSTPEAINLAVAPLFHLLGMQGGMNTPFILGATVVLMPRWDRAVAAQLIERYRVTSWGAPPAMLVDFFAQPGIESRDLSSLAFIGGGGAAMPAAVVGMLKQRFDLQYVEAYGMTETASLIIANPPLQLKSQCLGIPTFGVDARVIDPETLAELPKGETGELIVHGEQVMQGYWNNDKANAESYIERDGKRFLRTGDLVYADEEGYLHMRDRLKRMINASGYKVWPAEVENLLYGHPAIHEACVVAAQDEHRGETVRAVIVLKPQAVGSEEATPESIIAWCRERLAVYKVPRIVDIIDVLPKSATGKIMWRALQEQSIPVQAN
jgi:acyl-CoA synthetase (AMP-forming)/AMP-acid ligase II